MNITSTIPTPSFFYPGTSKRRRPAVRRAATRVQRPDFSPDTDDEQTRQQEVVCGMILALSSVSTVLLCLWQLAVS